MGMHFVLIHGAWHGGWCWEGVVRELHKAGHTAEAPTMPGHGAGDDRSLVTFDAYVEKVVEVLQRQPRAVVLAGHSSAGFVLQAAAPRAHDMIERLVFHNAAILPDGASQFDLVPEEQSGAMIAAAGASGDNSVPVDEELVRNGLMAGEPRDLQDALIARLVPQPLALLDTKVDTRPFKALNIPKTVLLCKDDAVVPAEAYLQMAAELGRFDLIELDGGHETLFTRPEVVATGLMKAAGSP